MRGFLKLALLMFALIPLSGCGGPTYDIPEVDEEISAKHREEIAEQMRKEMQKGMGGGRKRQN